MAYGTNTSGNAGQVAIDRFAEMMIARMEQMKACLLYTSDAADEL